MARIRTCSSLRGKGGVRNFAALIAVGSVLSAWPAMNANRSIPHMSANYFAQQVDSSKCSNDVFNALGADCEKQRRKSNHRLG